MCPSFILGFLTLHKKVPVSIKINSKNINKIMELTQLQLYPLYSYTIQLFLCLVPYISHDGELDTELTFFLKRGSILFAQTCEHEIE
jgi:hypothetical protein